MSEACDKCEINKRNKYLEYHNKKLLDEWSSIYYELHSKTYKRNRLGLFNSGRTLWGKQRELDDLIKELKK